jgi:tRNA (cytidine/uridine-2'-O-)-methyltransferase
MVNDSSQEPPVRVVLYRPEIAPNTGNIARLCAANGLPLFLVGRLGFRIDDRTARRAGLDYWPHVDLRRAATLDQVHASVPTARLICYSTRAARCYTDLRYRPGDCLVFGPESKGLPQTLLDADPELAVRIPMRSPHVRSLNLATAVAIAVYEALRQFASGDGPSRQVP